jgi:hypothetical protein
VSNAARLASAGLGRAFELATATNVPLWFIAAFEDGKATPDFLVCYEFELRAALEAAGVIFVEENGEGPGVRLRKGTTGESRRRLWNTAC